MPSLFKIPNFSKAIQRARLAPLAGQFWPARHMFATACSIAMKQQ